MSKTVKKQEETPQKNSGFAIPKENYKLMIIGLAIIVLGFILMTGGGADAPDKFYEDKLFSFRRITLSSILVVFGFAFEIYAIMKKPKNNGDDADKK
ncbi:MAG: DUF3098 domain-containing protein [Prevotellaceae bacterium]|jgi:ABC-type multidrug transport system fused ATPase/permease subunit|nr:DUF3098 domain-containing protein [Prevotellaceae bacterium]